MYSFWEHRKHLFYFVESSNSQLDLYILCKDCAESFVNSLVMKSYPLFSFCLYCLILLNVHKTANSFRLFNLNNMKFNERRLRPLLSNYIDKNINTSDNIHLNNNNSNGTATAVSVIQSPPLATLTTTTSESNTLPNNNLLPIPKLLSKYIPLYPHEIPKVLSLSIMMFFIIFVFSMTRDTKDILIVTNCGAEAIAFLKVYGVIPAATLFMIIYSYLSARYPLSTLFYIISIPFFLFFFIFAFVLYPARNFIHPTHLIVPKSGLSYMVQLLRFWSFSLYYIMSELWGSAGIPLLFWSCANEITSMEQVIIVLFTVFC